MSSSSSSNTLWSQPSSQLIAQVLTYYSFVIEFFFHIFSRNYINFQSSIISLSTSTLLIIDSWNGPINYWYNDIRTVQFITNGYDPRTSIFFWSQASIGFLSKIQVTLYPPKIQLLLLSNWGEWTSSFYVSI